MKKNMYSLMLAEEVVAAVDRLAAENATNRSNMVNQILAEHLSLVTPEKRIRTVFDALEREMADREAFSALSRLSATFSLKSYLKYRYRPTIRYEVEMYRTPETTLGVLKVAFRSQSAELLLELTDFFRAWMTLEERYIARFFPPDAIRYGLEEGKFTRTFALPERSAYSDAETGRAISAYIRTLDELMKAYLAGEYPSFTQLENAYLSRIGGAKII